MRALAGTVNVVGRPDFAVRCCAGTTATLGRPCHHGDGGEELRTAETGSAIDQTLRHLSTAASPPVCNPRTVDGRHLRHSGGPWGPSNPGGRRSYFPCELSASVTLEYEKEGGPASANYGAVPASRGGDRSTGGTAPDATRHCCRSRPTATETSVERPPRPRRSRTWPLAAIGGGIPAAVMSAADTAGVARPQLPPGRCADRPRRSRRLRSRRQRPCKC